jgi:hypothetical protein
VLAKRQVAALMALKERPAPLLISAVLAPLVLAAVSGIVVAADDEASTHVLVQLDIPDQVTAAFCQCASPLPDFSSSRKPRNVFAIP